MQFPLPRPPLLPVFLHKLCHLLLNSDTVVSLIIKEIQIKPTMKSFLISECEHVKRLIKFNVGKNEGKGKMGFFLEVV